MTPVGYCDVLCARSEIQSANSWDSFNRRQNVPGDDGHIPMSRFRPNYSDRRASFFFPEDSILATFVFLQPLPSSAE